MTRSELLWLSYVSRFSLLSSNFPPLMGVQESAGISAQEYGTSVQQSSFFNGYSGISASDYGCPRISRAIMGVQEFPQESPGIPSGKELVSFGDLERGVCSSIDHLRSRIREPEGGSAPASVSEFGKRFDGCPGFRSAIEKVFPGFRVNFGDLERVVCSSIGHPDRGFESLKVARLLPRWLRGSFWLVLGI